MNISGKHPHWFAFRKIIAIYSFLLISPSVLGILNPGTWQFETSTCGTYDLPYSPLFNSDAIQVACDEPGVVFLRAELIEDVNFSHHTHKVIYDKPGEYVTTIRSPAPWTKEGARIEVLLRGFLSFQGNPGDVFDVTATLVGMFGGVSATATIHEIMTQGGVTRQFSEFAFAQIPDGHPQGPHVSTLKVTMTGPGEFHSENSGISQVTPIPETGNSCWLLIVGCAATAYFGKRR